MENLEGERIARPQVRLVNAKGENALLELIIHEGKNRQVRRMCEQAELAVTRLKRIGEGCVTLGELPSLRESGIISGGMIPKVECCATALERGVRNVVIMDGRVPHAILMELLTDEGAGTMVSHG